MNGITNPTVIAHTLKIAAARVAHNKNSAAAQRYRLQCSRRKEKYFLVAPHMVPPFPPGCQTFQQKFLVRLCLTSQNIGFCQWLPSWAMGLCVVAVWCSLPTSPPSHTSSRMQNGSAQMPYTLGWVRAILKKKSFLWGSIIDCDNSFPYCQITRSIQLFCPGSPGGGAIYLASSAQPGCRFGFFQSKFSDPETLFGHCSPCFQRGWHLCCKNFGFSPSALGWPHVLFQWTSGASGGSAAWPGPVSKENSIWLVWLKKEMVCDGQWRNKQSDRACHTGTRWDGCTAFAAKRTCGWPRWCQVRRWGRAPSQPPDDLWIHPYMLAFMHA